MSARHASGTASEHSVASPDRKRVFKASSASSVPGEMLHYLVRRPSPLTAYCHAGVYSVTQRFDTASVQLRVNSVPTSHTGSALAYPAVWPTPPGYARMLSTNYSHPYPMMALTNNSHAPTVLPPTTIMDCLFPPSHSLQPPSHHRSCYCCLRKLSPPFI